MDIIELKKKYNYWLGRYLNAEKWLMESEQKEIDKYIDTFHQVVRELSLLIQEFRELTGIEMTKEEMFNGFSEVGK